VRILTLGQPELAGEGAAACGVIGGAAACDRTRKGVSTDLQMQSGDLRAERETLGLGERFLVARDGASRATEHALEPRR
jgi:hypothetical protein